MRTRHASLFALALFTLCGWSPAQAQHLTTVAGRIIDAETKEALPGVHVFLANTTRGASTDREGWYEIPSIPPGSYELVTSMVGFASQTARVEVRPGAEQLTVDFRLELAVYEMSGIEVAARQPRGWKKNLERFQEAILGSTENARKSEILNPYVLHFTSGGGVLVASAAEPLIIENRGLGYRITFVLSGLRLDQRKGTLRYSGHPHFEELEPTTEAEASAWRENREKAYRGSLQHLFWALIHDRVQKEGLMLMIDDRANAPVSQEPPSFRPITAGEIIQQKSVPHLYDFHFHHYLHVTYEKQEADFSFAFWKRREPDKQVSWLKMNGFGGIVFEDGSFFPPNPVTVYGYMTQERLADKLPLDYIRQLQKGEEQRDKDVASPEPLITRETGLPQDSNTIYPPESPEVEPAVEAIREQDWSRAMKVLDRILKQDADNLEARYYRGIVHREIVKFRTLTEFEHWRGGIEDFKFILKRDSTFRDVLYQYALYSRIPSSETELRKLNVSLTDAIELGHAQIRLRPDVPDHQFHLFTLYRRFLNHTGTEKVLAWLREHPSAFAEYFRGEALRRDGQLEAAGPVFDRLLSRELEMPRQPILLSRARVYYALEQPEQAEMFVRQAIEEIKRPLHAAFVFEDAKYIVSEEELQTYRRLSTPEDYKAFFQAFWARRNPMPAHEINLRLAEHYRRLLRAEEDYAYDGYRLWFNNPDKAEELALPAAYELNQEFNDKGLVYIRLGEPTDRVTTVAGQSSTFNSSLGMTGERSVFLPKDQSYRANWVPNESWRYSDLGMDFHFVIDEGSTGNNWRLTPALTNYEMLQDRMQWGGTYVHMARAAQQAEEHQLPSSNPGGPGGDPGGRDQSGAPAALDSWAVMDMYRGRNEMADSSRRAVERGLSMDRHTWEEDIRPMDFPYVTAAFRGENGLTDLELYYLLPVGLIAKEARADTLFVEVGIALHDLEWRAELIDRNTLELPTLKGADAAFVQALRLSAAPDSYHVALHVRPTGTRLVGGYKFEKHLPDFTRPELSISDLLVASHIEPRTEAPGSKRSDFRIVLNPYGSFKWNEPVYLYFEVYNLTYDEGDRVRYVLEYRLHPLEERRKMLGLFGRGGDELALSLRMDREGSEISLVEYAEIDVSRVPVGHYMLEVVVTDQKTGESVSQMVPIEITKS